MALTSPTTSPVRAPNRPGSILLQPEVHAWAMERPVVVAAGLRPGMTVVDLGCGDGTMTRFLAGEVGSEGTLVGIDADDDALGGAREADHTDDVVPVAWTAASAYDTGLDTDSVDFVLARHLFHQVGDPARALDEIRRILKPGGRLCIVDAYDGLLWIHPEPADQEAFLSSAAEHQRLRGGDRAVCRKLPAMLVEAGFDQVRADVHVYDSNHLPAELFSALALGPLADVFPAEDTDAQAHLTACREALAEGRAHGCAGFYATSAVLA